MKENKIKKNYSKCINDIISYLHDDLSCTLTVEEINNLECVFMPSKNEYIWVDENSMIAYKMKNGVLKKYCKIGKRIGNG